MAPWFKSMTRWPSPRSAMSLVWDLTGAAATTTEVAATSPRAAGFESAMTGQWYTTRRRGRILAPQDPRARSRVPLRPRPRGDATVLSRHPRARRDRHGQGRAHRVLLRRRPPSRRLLRAGARGRGRAGAQGRARSLPHRVRRGELARRARGRAPAGGGARAPARRRAAAPTLRTGPPPPPAAALARSTDLTQAAPPLTP